MEHYRAFTVHLSTIVWDTETDEGPLDQHALGLPNEATVIIDARSEDEAIELASDALTDEYGWCVWDYYGVAVTPTS